MEPRGDEALLHYSGTTKDGGEFAFTCVEKVEFIFVSNTYFSFFFVLVTISFLSRPIFLFCRIQFPFHLCVCASKIV
jgi:hypothetical protein